MKLLKVAASKWEECRRVRNVMLRKRCCDRKASRRSFREGLRGQINSFDRYAAIFTLVDQTD